MYTIKIENVEKTNGQPFASVCFTRDTGETEAYKELVLKTPEVAEVRDEETGEITVQGAEAVYEYIDKTRPVIEVVYERIAFNDEKDLDARVTAKKNELVVKHEAASKVKLGDYQPPEVVEPTPVVLTPEQEADAKKVEWLTRKAALKAMISDKQDMESIGATVSPEKLAIIQELAVWCDENAKAEYYL